jgi:GH25 family lysozyme M1 (1,4-beta-N-acetylmuramidase)
MRAHGIDISHWQLYYRPLGIPPRPVDFIIQKLSEGIFLDTYYQALKTDTINIPVRGGYHYFRGQWQWKAQMDIFLNALEGYDFWALDVEKAMNYSGLPILNKPYPGYIEAIPLALAYLRQNCKLPGLLYTGAGMWMDWLKPICSELLKYDLWVAHYWYQPNPEGTANYYTIKGAETMRRDWKFWQYDANGMSGRGREFGVASKGLDLNVFNGDAAALNAWAHPPEPKRCPTCGQVIP